MANLTNPIFHDEEKSPLTIQSRTYFPNDKPGIGVD